MSGYETTCVMSQQSCKKEAKVDINSLHVDRDLSVGLKEGTRNRR